MRTAYCIIPLSQYDNALPYNGLTESYAHLCKLLLVVREEGMVLVTLTEEYRVLDIFLIGCYVVSY